MEESDFQKIQKQMDGIDNRIILLFSEGRVLQISEIANRFGISIDEVERRLEKIKELGLIGYWET